MQNSTLFLLLNPFSVSRLHDNVLKAPKNARFTLSDLFSRLDRMIWTELGGKTGAPYISTIRRSLQRTYLGMLVDQALGRRWGAHEEAKTLSYRSLVNLGKRVDAVLAAKLALDAASEAHLMETSQRIKSALKAYFQRN